MHVFPLIQDRQLAEELVGAGLALPSFHATARLQGQGKPSPYETRGYGSAALRYTPIARYIG